MAKALRERVGKQYKGSQRMRKLTTENVRGVGEIDPSCKTPLSREPCAVKAARTGLTGGLGRRAVRERALILPTESGRGSQQHVTSIIPLESSTPNTGSFPRDAKEGGQ